MYDFQEEFYQVITRLRANSGSRSRAASTQEPKDDAKVTEIINRLLVSKPAASKKEPEIIDLQEYAKSGKAASVRGINKAKAIHDFFISKGRS